MLIAGRGLDEDICARINKESMEKDKILAHLEFIPDDEVQIYMNASDVMVLPYTNVLTSGAAILALSFYKPVIAPKKGLLPELVNDDIGYLFSSTNELEEQMEKCLVNMKNSPFLKKPFKHKLEELEWNTFLKKSVFNQLMK